MKDVTILVVDDEKNILLSLQEALAPLGHTIVTAPNGEAALHALENDHPALMLLDLQMPGLNGMEVLRRAASDYPSVRAIIITAHGNVSNAVDAMKLGAVDFIQKPFSVAQIRGLVTEVLARDRSEGGRGRDFNQHIEEARHRFADRQFGSAREHVARAISINPGSAVAYNMLGVLDEVAGRRVEAQMHYRIALEMEPDYEVARDNLARATKSLAERSSAPVFG
jgi:DNA-binding NtrC family response regulator